MIPTAQRLGMAKSVVKREKKWNWPAARLQRRPWWFLVEECCSNITITAPIFLSRYTVYIDYYYCYLLSLLPWKEHQLKPSSWYPGASYSSSSIIINIESSQSHITLLLRTSSLIKLVSQSRSSTAPPIFKSNNNFDLLTIIITFTFIYFLLHIPFYPPSFRPQTTPQKYTQKIIRDHEEVRKEGGN